MNLWATVWFLLEILFFFFIQCQYGKSLQTEIFLQILFSAVDKNSTHFYVRHSYTIL